MAFTKGQSGNPKGRPRKSEQFAGQVAKAEKQIADRLPQLIQNMMTLADGVTVQEVDPKSGGVLVYSKPPDFKANEYLINRVMGKPTERTEVSGPDGGAVQVEMMTRALTKAYGDDDAA
jgi:3-deoxy-D-arabino-heptulosonate 7-phosphate (DAHP) synthase class II